MLEIDGELFEDPCEIRRMEKNIAAVKIAMQTTIENLKTETDLQRHIITDIAKVTIGIILAQPLWPRFAEGGIIVNRPNTAGDLMTEAIKGEIKAYKDVGIVLRNEAAI